MVELSLFKNTLFAMYFKNVAFFPWVPFTEPCLLRRTALKTQFLPRIDPDQHTVAGTQTDSSEQ